MAVLSRYFSAATRMVALSLVDQVHSNNGLPTYRVKTGVLRGTALSVPVLERPSYALGTYEPKVVSALRRQLHAGDVAFDVGAHVGYLSLVMAKLVGQSGKVVAFEPDQRNLAALKVNVAQNHASNLDVVGQPVSSDPEILSFASYTKYSLVNHVVDSHTRAKGDAQLTSIQATTIDAHCSQSDLRPSLIKIDVEGHEASVVKGALTVIGASHPAILVEVRPDTFVAIQALLKPFGYSFQLLGGRARGLTEDGIDDVLFV